MRQEQVGHGIRQFGGRVVLSHEGQRPEDDEDQHLPPPAAAKADRVNRKVRGVV